MVYALSILELAGLNIILALSVYATLMVGQFSLAQVGFWSIGAYSVGMLTTLFGVPLALALVMAGLLCGVIGILLGYPCLRIRGIYLTLATVAFSEVVRVFFHNFEYLVQIGGIKAGPAGPQGFRGINVLTAWPEILVAVFLVVGVFAWIQRSRLGLSANAVREDETAALCAGINIVAVKVGMFSLGAVVAGVGGGLYATYVSYISSDNFGFHLALISIFFVAVGGTERFIGPVVGALLLTALPEVLRVAGDYRMIVYGLIVLAVMVLCPRGLADEVRARMARARARRGAPVAMAVAPAGEPKEAAP